MKFLVEILGEIWEHFFSFWVLLLALIFFIVFGIAWKLWDAFWTFIEICEGSKKVRVVRNPDYKNPIR